MTKMALPADIYDVKAAIDFFKCPPQDEYQLPVIVPFSISGKWSISVEDENGNKVPYWVRTIMLSETHIEIRVSNDVEKVYIYPVFEDQSRKYTRLALSQDTDFMEKLKILCFEADSSTDFSPLVVNLIGLAMWDFAKNGGEAGSKRTYVDEEYEKEYDEFCNEG